MASESSAPGLIVGIGASAGGLAPIEEFFDHMPSDTGMAFVVVQHLSPDFKSLMDELLARHTKMSIHKVVDGIQVERNSIYLIPPEKNMALEDGKLRLTDQEHERGLNLPIDIFFRSLAKDGGDRAIAVVLSGTGSDGSRGVVDVKEAGGVVIVQSPDSAGFDGMPQAAINSGATDLVCTPSEIARRLLKYLSSRSKEQLQVDLPSGPAPLGDTALFNILRMFRLHYGVDFALYKPATISRRIERRMQMGGFTELAEYAAYLEENGEELEVLFRDLLVEVTQFFRDRAAFERLRTDVVPQIVHDAEANEGIRIWVPGCATGEEAYSLAMLFADAIQKCGREIDFKVFATDIHRHSLETASMAVYQSQVLENVLPEFQNKFFTRSNGLCHIKREIRQRVIFAANDLTSDPPFTRIDLISCRNVLIYLEPRVQRRVLSLFHFGLKTGGTLFLGPSETVGDLSTEFDSIDRHWRIYRKLRDVRLPDAARLPVTPTLHSVVREKHPVFVANGPKADPQGWIASANEDLLAKYVPPSLMVNDFGELVHTFGDARKLLIQPEGRATLDVLKLLSSEVRTAVSAGLHRAKQEDKAVVFRGIHHPTPEGDETLKITIEPYRKATQNLYLICIEPMEEMGPPPAEASDLDIKEFANERITQLERELGYTRETLQATVEELESSNEELQATNEELIASNEELQSTNEELHSVNEELYTVNSEHKQKIEELTQITSDMDNLLKSTDIGTVFLDSDFKIRMFTPAISAAFNVLPQDVGRPIDHIAYKLDSPALMDDCAEVLRTKISREIEVRSDDRRVFLQRIQPYRNEDGDVEGIVLTTTDVTAIKEAEKAQRTMMTLAQINEELPDFAYAVSHDLRAPMRHISHYSKVLEQAVSDGDADEITKALRVINESGTALSEMLDGLLAYSRINTRGLPMQRVSLNESVSDASHDLLTSLENNESVVDFDELPNVFGDPKQLQLLFYHLIDNAIKYCGDSPPSIRVSSVNDEDGDLVTVTVADNGIGIDDEHRERVFAMFKRLHHTKSVPGTGIGLALVKRIVVRHGGQIWLETNPEGGLMVRFTLRIFQPGNAVEALSNAGGYVR